MSIETWDMQHWRTVLKGLAMQRMILNDFPLDSDDPQEYAIICAMYKDVQVRLSAMLTNL